MVVTLMLSACTVHSTTSGGPPPPPPPTEQQPPPPPPAAQRAWDSTGWTLLGAQTVDGRRDRDTIVVGKQEGRFDQLTLVVQDSDLELNDFLITFGNKETFQPNVRHVFREGSRTRVIDLPGNDRFISRIDLRYANIPGGGKARVEVWARNVRGGGPPGPRPPAPGPAWDSTGWTLLGSQTVSGHGGKADKDVIHVGKHEGRYDELTMVVTDSDLELVDFVVTFGNNETFRPQVKHVFREGSRSRSIDLPGNTRAIKKIDLTYANLPGGGKARVEIWGRQRGGAAPAPVGGGGGAVFDSKGWTLLGSQTVSGHGGKADKDVIVVGKQEGKFDQLTMVVTDSDLDLIDLVVTFGNGSAFAPKLKHLFKEGARTRVIDLPGNDRFIKQIELTYANLPGGGKARVEVWGRNVGKRR
jgi:hypothetical protein